MARAEVQGNDAACIRCDGTGINRGRKCGRCGGDGVDLDLSDGEEVMDYTPLVPLVDAEKLATALERAVKATWNWPAARETLAEWRAAHPREETTG